MRLAANVQSFQDWRLVPMLAVLYLISQLDRANIGNAKIEGLDTDLKLSGVQYNICNSLFFVPYVLLEVPSNIVLKKFSKPSVYLGTLVTAWGIVMTCHGFAKDFPGLLVLRLILGTLEAGFYPGAVYLCTFWCKCHTHSFPRPSHLTEPNPTRHAQGARDEDLHFLLHFIPLRGIFGAPSCRHRGDGRCRGTSGLAMDVSAPFSCRGKLFRLFEEIS